MWAVLGADQGLNWRSLEGIRAYLTVLGADQGLPGRSWERIRAYVGGPGGSKAEKWPKPEREQGPKGSGPPKIARTPRIPKGPESLPIFSIDTRERADRSLDTARIGPLLALCCHDAHTHPRPFP